MATRQCPNCGAMMPAARVVTDSYDLVCESCQHALGISALSRNLAMFTGLAAGVIAWWIVTLKFADHPGALGWVWPVFFCYLAASAVAALALMFTANLELRAGDSAPLSEPVTSRIPH